MTTRATRATTVGHGNLAGLGSMLARRSVAILAVTISVTILMFALTAASPFDPLAQHLGAEYHNLTAAERAATATALGLDQPWWAHWADWATNAARGDLGFSRTHGRDVTEVLAQRLPLTLLLSITGMLLAFTTALVAGVAAGARPQGLLNRMVSVTAALLAATPPFIWAVGTILLFAVTLQLIPAGGAAPLGQTPTFVTAIGPHLVAPAIVLAVTQLPWPLLAVRDAAVKAHHSAAVESARMRGVPSWRVLTHHVLPMAATPAVSLAGARLGDVVAGAVVVEAVFSWPGIAEATVSAAAGMDFPMLAATTVLTTLLVMVGALVSDVLYLLLDPRVRDV